MSAQGPSGPEDGLQARIDAHLAALHLPGALACYRELAGEVGATEPALRLLEGALAAEMASRAQHRYDRNLRAARLPVVKELAAFDYAAIPSIPRARLEELAGGQFIAAHESVILVGNPGTGKTHVLSALCLEAVRHGFRARFVTAAVLVNELLLARQELRVPKLLRPYGGFDLVAVDELGYVPFSREAAQLLFEFFADRYERRATALTTNLPFAQWAQVFGDETMTVALLDRLTHRSHVLMFNGESYRAKESRGRGGPRAAAGAS
jgi:DNA replication protein DnaC